MEKLRLNIQKFAGATISGSSTASNCNCRIVWTSTTQGSTAAEKSQLNKSNVTATIQIYKSGSSSTTGTFSGSITINGKSTSVSKKFSPYNWGSWATVGSATVSGIEHNADGKKSISISGTLTQGGTSMAGTYKASGTAVLDTINRLSTITSVTKTTIDKQFSITFPDYGLYYDLNVGYLNPETFTGYNVLEVRDVKNNTNYSIPSASIPGLYEEFTGSGGIDLWAALKIYADEARTQPIYTNSSQDAWEAIGINFGYGNIPPTASITITGEQNNTMKNLNWGIYVQGKSQIGVQINGTAQYGATITGRTSSTNGITYNQASYTTGAITASGDNLVKARVTDSRGQQSAEASSSYYVYPYAQPSVTLHSAERCDANGNVKDNGTYLRVAFSSNIYACNNKNAKSVSVYAGNYSSVISTSYSNSQTVSIVNANLSSSTSYDIQLKATDSFTEVVSNTIRLSTSDLADIFHFHKSGKSMAIGGKSTANDSDKNLEVYMKSNFKSDLYADRLESYGTSGEHVVRANSNGNDIYLFANQNNVGVYSSSRNAMCLDNSGSGWNFYGNATTATKSTNADNLNGGILLARRYFVYALDALVNSQGTYYKIADIPASGGSNAAQVNIKGELGSWVSKATIDIQIKNRDGLSVSGFYYGDGSVLNDSQRIVVFQNGDGSHSVYLYNASNYVGGNTLEISYSCYGAAKPTITTDYSYTTSPGGTLVAEGFSWNLYGMPQNRAGILAVNNDLFYQAGDTVTLTDFIANGFVTSSTTNVYLDVVLPKRIDGLTVRATSVSAEIRGQKGYINSTSGSVQYVGKSGYTITIYKTSTGVCNKIALRINKSSAWTNIDNNSMVSAFFGNLTLSFS